MDNELTVQENKKGRIKSKVKKFIIITAALILLIPAILYFGFIILMTADTHYYIFTEKRTEQMEERFQITVTDDVKLLHYEDSSFLIAENCTLTLETEDYEKFINNNINADIEEDPYDNASERILHYKYVHSNREVTISPSKHKGKYTVTIHYWA
ncbi:MAG: hypothetical protein K2N72_00345 [Oscillospiraceae bacterium]|nr:hypothetical protein [Oscillospiraceae bacterium]